MTATLLTLSPSHYSEKARWALDRLGVDYREQAHGPGFHFLALRRVGGVSMPTLLIDGNVLKDSTDILHFLDARAPEEKRLFPAEPALRKEVEALEHDLDERLGHFVRDWVYSWALDDSSNFMGVFTRRVPALHRFAANAMAPFGAGIMKRRFNLSRLPESGHFEALWKFFEEYDAKLSDGRAYLVGDRFTAADLALAALSAPALGQEGFGGGRVPFEKRSPVVQERTRQLRESRVGRHVARMYREHRPPVAQ